MGSLWSQVTWPQAVTFYQHFTGLGLQRGYDDGAGVARTVTLEAPLSVQGAGAAVPCPLLHRVGAGVAGGVRVGGVVDCDTADDVFPLLGDCAAKLKEKVELWAGCEGRQPAPKRMGGRQSRPGPGTGHTDAE